MQKNGNFPFWISKEFSNTFAFRPDIIVIKLGTNDTKLQNWNPQNFELDYQSMIDTLATISTHPKIFMCLPVPVFKTNWGINDSTLTNGVIPILERLAKKNKLQLIDLYQPMTIEIVNFPDFIHPNEIAVKKMAKLIAAAIQPK
jgi:alpha-L-fucosidase 2